MVEVLCFLFAVLPYWYTISLPVKDTKYWIILLWCCVCFMIYFVHHAAIAGFVTNAVEFSIAATAYYKASTKDAIIKE